LGVLQASTHAVGAPSMKNLHAATLLDRTVARR
jgi:hypothetical protein